MVTSITYVNGSPLVLERGVAIMRLMKHGGVTHAVWRTVPDFRDVNNPIRITETLCRWRTNLPWQHTKRFRETQVNCMGCQVRLSKL